MRQFCMKMDEEEFAALALMARRLGIAKSELVRRAIKQYLLQNMRERPYMTKRIRVY